MYFRRAFTRRADMSSMVELIYVSDLVAVFNQGSLVCLIWWQNRVGSGGNSVFNLVASVCRIWWQFAEIALQCNTDHGATKEQFLISSNLVNNSKVEWLPTR